MTLKAFVTASRLSEEDKDLWFSILTKLDDVQIKIFEDFVDPVRSSPPKSPSGAQSAGETSNGVDSKEENLKLLTENLKSKVEAIKNLDEEAMEKIIQQEAELSSKPIS